MTSTVGPTLTVRARGELACFTRPELKVERVSYPVMTPSAARGLLEAILWKPGMRWKVERIRVLAPIRFIAFRRNEVATKAARPSRALVESGGAPPVYFADDDRSQRNTVALRDVDYEIEARIEMTRRAGPQDNLTKFVAMFQRRLDRGQHFHHPYLGCREFPAWVETPAASPRPIEETRDLGIMLWDLDYRDGDIRPRFFEARLETGVLEIPQNPEKTFAAGDAE